MSSAASTIVEGQLRLARAALEEALRSKVDRRAEALLIEYPAVANDPEAALELVYTEFAMREALGQNPDPAEWYARFPQWRTDLEQMFEVHRELKKEESNQRRSRSQPAAEYRQLPPNRAGANTIGEFEVLGEVGRGGMGVVYKARQASLGRVVAVKVILAGAHAGALDRERFRREAETAARLDHPNIVRIFAVGEHDGRAYCAMEYVDGASLAELFDGRPWPTRKAAELMATVATAAQHAHENGIVHRDLKPANILLVGTRKQGAVNPTVQDRPATPNPSSGSRPSVKVVDFGLAKSLLDTDPGPSRTGDIIGTPAYMAPEQAAAAEISPGTDVWGMGVTLYELLVGHTPFQGATTVETLEQVRSAEPVSPRRLRPSLPRDLEVICLKCLRKDPRHRYPTASALAEDLNRFLRGEPILARPASTVEHVTRWCRRNPAVAILLACLLVVLVVGVSGIVALWQQADHERDQAVDARNNTSRVYQQKEEVRAQADSRLYAVQITQAALDLAASRPLAAEQILDECMARAPEQCGWEWHYLKRRCRTHVLEMPGHTQPVNSLAYSPDGSRIASGAGDWNGTEPGEVKLWDAKTGKLLKSLAGPKATVHRVAFHPNGDWLFAACTDKSLYRWSLRDPDSPATRWEFESGLFSVAVSPDGKTVGVSLLSGGVSVMNATTGEVLHSYPGHGHNAYDIAYSPDGKCLASVCRDGRVTVRATDDFRELYRVYHPTDARRVLFTPDGRYMVSASHDGAIKFWDRTDGYRAVATQNVGMGNLANLVCRPDGLQLACCTNQSGMKMWWVRGQMEAHTPAASGGMPSVAFSPDSRWMAAAQDDLVIRVWNTDPPDDPRWFPASTSWISTLAVSPDGAAVTVGNGENWSHRTGAKVTTITVCDLATGRVRAELKEHTEWLTAIAYHPDGQRLIAADKSGAVKLWDVQRQAVELPLRGHEGAVHGVAYLPDGQRAVTAGEDGTVRVWDAATGKELLSFPHPRAVLCVAISSDGRLVATGCADHGVRVWEVESGRLVHSFSGHKANVTAVAFRPNSPALASADESQGLHFWNTDNGQLLSEHAYDRHQHLPEGDAERDPSPRRASYLSFSRDGRRLAFGSTRGATQVWDAEGQRRLLELGDSENRELHPVAFAPGGEALVTAHRGQVRVWELQSPAPRTPADWDDERLVAGYARRAGDARKPRDWFVLEYYSDLIVRAHPDDATWLARRGWGRMLLGHPAEADADHRQALDLVKSGTMTEPVRAARLELVWNRRGVALAHCKRWAEAEEAFRETTRIRPNNPGNWANLAETLLAQKKMVEYRECCGQMLKRFARVTATPAVVAVITPLVSMPQGENREALLRLCDLPAATFDRETRALGALLFRVGKYEEAMAQFKATQAARFRLRAWDMLFRAMAYHHLKQPFEARDWLNKARDWIAEADRVAATPTAWSDFAWGDWNEEVQTRTLLKEAEALLKESTAK